MVSQTEYLTEFYCNSTVISHHRRRFIRYAVFGEDNEVSILASCFKKERCHDCPFLYDAQMRKPINRFCGWKTLWIGFDGNWRLKRGAGFRFLSTQNLQMAKVFWAIEETLIHITEFYCFFFWDHFSSFYVNLKVKSSRRKKVNISINCYRAISFFCIQCKL